MEGSILDSRGIVRISGAEWRPFLQGLVTNDVDRLDGKTALYAGLLTPQGKFLHDFIVVAWEDGALLDTEGGRTAELIRRLTLYRLRAKVTIEDVSETIGVVALLPNGDVPAPAASVVVADPRHPAMGMRAYIDGSAADWLAQQGIIAAEAGAFEARRIELGIPDGSRDIPVEKAFPLEYGFDRLHAVSYDKGCFVGQELTARTHNRGKVKKGLYRLTLEGDAPPAGTDLMLDDSTIGEILSAHGRTALAHARIDAMDEASRMHAAGTKVVEATAAPVAGTVTGTP